MVNDAALAYMRKAKLPDAAVECLARHRTRRFASEADWTAHLDLIGLEKLSTNTKARIIATEAAIWGRVVDLGHLVNAVIVSDGAGQFNLGKHALCWVHMERHFVKMVAHSDDHLSAIEWVRSEIRRLYNDIKDYRECPNPETATQLQRRFTELFSTRTGHARLDQGLERTYANKDQLLMTLERPETPTHTNGSENDIRCHVTRRDISSGTRSENGRVARDALLGLMKTCMKQGVSFWDYLGDRCGVPGAKKVAWLPDLVRQGLQHG